MAISAYLGWLLDANVGDTVEVDLLDGRRRIIEVFDGESSRQGNRWRTMAAIREFSILGSHLRSPSEEDIDVAQLER